MSYCTAHVCFRGQSEHPPTDAVLPLDFLIFDLRRGRLMGDIKLSVAHSLFGQAQINERHALELSDQD